MGLFQSKLRRDDFSNLNMDKCRQMRNDLSDNDIKQIYKMFLRYEPKNGLVNSREVQNQYEEVKGTELLREFGYKRAYETSDA